MIIGVDPGERRIGIALADQETRWARALEVIDSRKKDPVVRIAELVEQHAGTVVVVGRPVGLTGHSGPAVEVQQKFIARLRDAVTVPIEEFDERLTTVAADRRLKEAGASAARRKAVKDAVAAQLMLQDYLDSRA